MATKQQPKVFLIGRAKTGTRSIDKALNILGYNTLNKHQDLDFDNIAEDVIKKMKSLSAFTATCNFTIEDIRAIERAYPDAVFILTERDIDAWYGSWIRHHSKAATEDDPRKRELDYKHKGYWVDNYYGDYNHDVLTHFKGREWKLFHIHFGRRNDNWGNLCAFLKKPLPKGGFPHENKS